MTTTNQETIEVKLLGQRVLLKSSEADPEIMQQAVRLASNLLSDVETRSPDLPPHQVALLALLDLAEEYTKAKMRTEEYKRQVEFKSSKIFSLVEAAFK